MGHIKLYAATFSVERLKTGPLLALYELTLPVAQISERVDDYRYIREFKFCFKDLKGVKDSVFDQDPVYLGLITDGKMSFLASTEPANFKDVLSKLEQIAKSADVELITGEKAVAELTPLFPYLALAEHIKHHT